MRRAPHEGQNPSRLQLKATSLSWAKYRDNFVDAGPLRDPRKGALEMLAEIIEPIDQKDYRLKGNRGEVILPYEPPGTNKPTLTEFFKDRYCTDIASQVILNRRIKRGLVKQVALIRKKGHLHLLFTAT